MRDLLLPCAGLQVIRSSTVSPPHQPDDERKQNLENPSLVLAISKLAAAGEQAGFTLEQMIELLDTGLEVETLLELILLAASGSSVARIVIKLGGVAT